MRASCAALLLACAAGVAAAQQPRNLLEEPTTTFGAEAWRVEPDITDRPYLYGMTYSAEGRIVAHHQGGAMGSRAARPDERTVLWGAFSVPKGAARISFQLGQGLRRGVPHTGNAAKFYEPGRFLFATRDEAEAFAERYPLGGMPLRATRPHLR